MQVVRTLSIASGGGRGKRRRKKELKGGNGKCKKQKGTRWGVLKERQRVDLTDLE